MTTPRITLDQWAALVAVVEQGGYGPASERLHRTQSTVTYTIKRLEDQLGLKVFERQGRRAALTPAGQVLYRRGKSLRLRITQICRDVGIGLFMPVDDHRFSLLKRRKRPVCDPLKFRP